MTSANRIGVSSGTSNSRGVRTVSQNRRCASVVSGSAMAVISSFLSGRFGQSSTGEAEVDVVEGRLPGVDRARDEADAVDRSDRLGRRAVVKWEGQGRADGEPVAVDD